MTNESFEGKSVLLRPDPEMVEFYTSDGFREGGYMEIDDHCTEETLIEGIEETKELLQVTEIRLVPTLADENTRNYGRCIIFVRN